MTPLLFVFKMRFWYMVYTKKSPFIANVALSIYRNANPDSHLLVVAHTTHPLHRVRGKLTAPLAHAKLTRPTRRPTVDDLAQIRLASCTRICRRRTRRTDVVANDAAPLGIVVIRLAGVNGGALPAMSQPRAVRDRLPLRRRHCDGRVHAVVSVKRSTA